MDLTRKINRLPLGGVGERTGNFFESQLCSISEEEITWRDDKTNLWNPNESFFHESLVHLRFIKAAIKKLVQAEEDCMFLNKYKSCPIYKCDSRLIIGDFIKVLLTSVADLLSLDEMQAELVWKKICCGKHVKAMDTY